MITLRNILWFLTGWFIVHSINEVLGVDLFTRIFTSIVLWFILFKTYDKIIPNNWK